MRSGVGETRGLIRVAQVSFCITLASCWRLFLLLLYRLSRLCGKKVPGKKHLKSIGERELSWWT
jgi:hypothetical protein